jgi:tetratricopeptide (TPR) repeat protein
VIHRDVKPENILLYEGHATLADFGIALAVSEASGGRLTETGLSLGTPQYMSPEQATGERQLDARSDIYSLGVVLYEMLAGDPPFTGRTGQAVVAKLMTERPTPLRLLRDTLPPAVDDAVARALAKVPADRFTTAAAFAAALTDGPPTDRRPPSRRLSRPMAMLAPLIFLAAGAIGWRLVFGGHRRPARDPEVVALAQRALQGYNRRTPAGAIEAIRQYEDAVRRDSTYSTAWAGLAKTAVRCYMRYFEVPGIGPDSLLRLAVYAADRAVETDSANADAWLARAQVSRSVDPTDPEPPIRAVRRALALDSTLAEGWHFLALGQAESGDFADGMTNWRRTVRVGPTYAWGLAFLGLGHYWQRQYDSAAFWADSSLTFDPNYLLGRETMGYVAIERGQYARGVAAFDAARRLTGDVEEVNALAGAALGEARAGRKGEARSLVQRAESLAARYLPVPSHTAVYIAQVHAALGDRELALAWLTRFQPRGDLHFQLHLRCDPPFDPLHADPRFRALLVMPLPPPGKGC